MTPHPKDGSETSSKLDAIIDEAYKESLSKGAGANEIFVAGMGTATAGLVLLNISALPGAVHAMGIVMTFVGVLAMVLIRRKL